MLIITLMACLAGVTLYLAKRWSDSKTENAGLRARIASLKRQLGTHGTDALTHLRGRRLRRRSPESAWIVRLRVHVECDGHPEATQH